MGVPYEAIQLSENASANGKTDRCAKPTGRKVDVVAMLQRAREGRRVRTKSHDNHVTVNWPYPDFFISNIMLRVFCPIDGPHYESITHTKSNLLVCCQDEGVLS